LMAKPELYLLDLIQKRKLSLPLKEFPGNTVGPVNTN